MKLLRNYGFDYIDLSNDYQWVLENGLDNSWEPKLDSQKLKALRADFGKKFSPKDGNWLLIKNPWWFFFPNFVTELFAEDELRTICIFRDGKDQVVSKDYWLRDTNRPEAKLMARARFWNLCMSYYKEHWKGREKHLDLRYEALCADANPSIAKCMNLLGLDPNSYPDKYLDLPSLKNKKWEDLDPKLKEEVLKIVSPGQAIIDEYIPD